MANDDYRIRFADHVAKQFFNGGVMSVEGLQGAYKRRTDEIDRAIILESARWGDAAYGVSQPYTKEDWDTHRDWIMNEYFPRRVDIAVDQFESRGWLGDLDLPTFTDHGGFFEEGYAVEIKKSVFAKGNIVYTLDDSDPRLPGGDLSELAMEYDGPVALDGSATVRARLHQASVFGPKEWSPLLEATFVVGAVPAASENLTIALINYHPPGASESEKAKGFSRKDFEFMGLQNFGEQTVSLRGLELTEGIRFDFGQASHEEIEPGQTVFLVKNAAAFEARYGTALAVIGEYQGSLSNDGERLLLVSGETTVADFAFNDNDQWPRGTDGEGNYLVLDDPGARPDSSKGGSWRASTPEDSPAPLEGGGGVGGDLTYAQWSATVFPEGELRSAAGEDADGDDFVNYLEFLMGIDPLEAASKPHVAVERSAEDLPIFEMSRRVGVADALVVETGRTLADWNAVPDPALEHLETRPGPDAATEIQRFRVLQLTKDAVWTERFLRVRTTLP